MGCRLGWRGLARGNLLLDAEYLGATSKIDVPLSRLLRACSSRSPSGAVSMKRMSGGRVARQRPTSRSASSYIRACPQLSQMRAAAR